jgi:hypothetical protein
MREEDKRNEEIIKAYSHIGTFEYIPRARPEDENVTAKPVEMPKCVICGKMEPEPFECEHCGQYYCDDHLAPEKHDCTYAKEKEEQREQEELALKMALMSKIEGLSAHRPDIYMLIDHASSEELKDMIGHLDALEQALAKVSGSNVEE